MIANPSLYNHRQIKALLFDPNVNIDLSGYEYGEVLRAKRRQRPIMQYSKDGRPLQKFKGIKDAAAAVGVNSTSIIGALSGRQITSGGYKWEYL